MTKPYGQFCPVAKAAEVFCKRWTPLILRDLAIGATRFSELQRGVPLASPTLLSQRLKHLEKEGIVQRRMAPGGGVWTYHLSPAREELASIVLSLGVWGQKWSRRELAQHEVDLGLLLWAMERGAKPDAFGPGRTVIELTFHRSDREEAPLMVPERGRPVRTLPESAGSGGRSVRRNHSARHDLYPARRLAPGPGT